eukprot:10463193-Alexandrium_andersonii.AAC.1
MSPRLAPRQLQLRPAPLLQRPSLTPQPARQCRLLMRPGSPGRTPCGLSIHPRSSALVHPPGNSSTSVQQ